MSQNSLACGKANAVCGAAMWVEWLFAARSGSFLHYFFGRLRRQNHFSPASKKRPEGGRDTKQEPKPSSQKNYGRQMEAKQNLGSRMLSQPGSYPCSFYSRIETRTLTAKLFVEESHQHSSLLLFCPCGLQLVVVVWGLVSASHPEETWETKGNHVVTGCFMLLLLRDKKGEAGNKWRNKRKSCCVKRDKWRDKGEMEREAKSKANKAE